VTESQPADLRIGDVERESAMTALGEHMSSGRLNIDEYGDRSAQVTTAKTRGELLALFADLPAPHPTFGGAAATPAPAQEPETAPAQQNPGNRPAAHRFFHALVPLSALAGVVLLCTTSLWFMIFLPAVVVILGNVFLGDGWRHTDKHWKHEQLQRQWELKARHHEQRMEHHVQRMAYRAERMRTRMDRHRRDRW
jgi:hypothetical protein